MAGNAEPSLSRPNDRLVSLDVFRGITIAGMILVNNPGSRAAVYAPLDHAKWNGWTPTDFIFPFFLFIVGIAITFSFDRRLAAGYSRMRLWEQVVRRTLLLFLLGLALGALFDWKLVSTYLLGVISVVLLFWDGPPLNQPQCRNEMIRKSFAWLLLVGGVACFVLIYPHFQETRQRIPGVLQRIAWSYFFAALIALFWGTRGRLAWFSILVLGYWAVCRFVHAPSSYDVAVLGPEGLLHAWVDDKVLGIHISGTRPDSLGVLSTLPAIASTLLGVLTGGFLRAPRSNQNKACWLLIVGVLLIAAGLCMNFSTPINKKIWTSSYVFFTGGIAMAFLATCLWLIDVIGLKRWAWPFLVLGTNAITVFCVSSVLTGYLIHTKVHMADGTEKMLKAAIFDQSFAQLVSPHNASLMYAVCYVVLWTILFVPLYRKRIFIRI